MGEQWIKGWGGMFKDALLGCRLDRDAAFLIGGVIGFVLGLLVGAAGAARLLS